MKKKTTPGIRKTGFTVTKQTLSDGRKIKTTQASAGRSKVTRTKVTEPISGGVKKSVAKTISKPMNKKARASVDYYESRDLPPWRRGKSEYMTTKSKGKTTTKIKKTKSKRSSSTSY